MKLRVLLISLALFLPAVACSMSPVEEGGGDVPPLPDNILFQDDFSDPTSGWDSVNLPEGITDYSDGVYRIFVNDINTDVWSNPGLKFTDARIEVDAVKVGGSDDNDLGVICRYVDLNNFYFFIISSDGYYGIGKVKDGSIELIGVDSMQPSEEINQGSRTNHLRADCIGNKLSLYVNDNFLVQYEDADYPAGDVGLIAGTSIAAPGTDVHFDNFKVFKP